LCKVRSFYVIDADLQLTHDISIGLLYTGGSSISAGPIVEVRVQRFSRVGDGTCATSGENYCELSYC